MQAAPPAIWIVMVPTGVTVLLRLHNPPCSWTGMVVPFLPGFTIALVWIPCDEGIPTSLPSSVDDIAGRVEVQHKPDDLRTRPITKHVPSYWKNR
jgi:hypothetical protein